MQKIDRKNFLVLFGGILAGMFLRPFEKLLGTTKNNPGKHHTREAKYYSSSDKLAG